MPVNNTNKGLIENSHRESNYEKADKEKNCKAICVNTEEAQGPYDVTWLENMDSKHTSTAGYLVTSILNH